MRSKLFHQFITSTGGPATKFSKELGIAYTTLMRYKYGLRKPPVELLIKIKKVLKKKGVDIQWDFIMKQLEKDFKV